MSDAIRQRLALRRLLLQRLFRSPAASRAFTSNTSLASRGRPQLPFLSIPVTTTTASRRKVRYFTTENKQWLNHEGRLFFRYNVSIWGTLACVAAIILLLNQEWIEKECPTPHEWTFLTRMRVRGAKTAARTVGNTEKNWDEIIVSCQAALKRLEDPKIDGAGVRELLNDEPLSVEGLGNVGKDVSEKEEPWRRGYYEVLMLLANTLEHVDGWVKDTSRNIVCPPEMVVGPSNLQPQPMPAGAPGAPREENCEIAYESAENVYLRILTTKGFNVKQKMDAALAYAFFLDYKKMPDVAQRVYDWALAIALETTTTSSTPETAPLSPPLVDPRTWTLNDKTTAPPDNVLSALTAMATHKARAGDMGAALPIFISILRARRSLPSAPPAEAADETAGFTTTTTTTSNFWQQMWKMAQPPQYPPPPPDGTQVPWRSTRHLCEEAALHLYIGEILYSGKDTLRAREEGLAWTRDGVDMAEEQLRKLGPPSAFADRSTRATCKDCLSTGLQNWTAMVRRLARKEEEERKEREEGGRSGSTFGGFWSQSRGGDESEGRWAAEEKVVLERIKRTTELLVDVAPPPRGLQDLLKA